MTNNMDIFGQMIVKIIQEQEGIIGPIALEQAKKVPGLTLDWDKHQVEIKGDEKTTVDQLVEQYKHLFGQASVEVCREATRDLMRTVPQNQRPALLS